MDKNKIDYPKPGLEAIKLEYNFVESHLRDLVRIRFIYFAAYLTFFGAIVTRSIDDFGYFGLLVATIFLWCVELRTRVIIRCCTRRLTDIEVEFFNYNDGFFRFNHPNHSVKGQNDETKPTTPGLKYSVFIPTPVILLGGILRYTFFKKRLMSMSFFKRYALYLFKAHGFLLSPVTFNSEHKYIDYGPAMDFFLSFSLCYSLYALIF